MPPPVFDESRSVIQQPRSHWPKIGRWAVAIGAAVFPLPFAAVALVGLIFSKAEDPNVSGLWGDMRWILGAQLIILPPLYAALGDASLLALDQHAMRADRIGAWSAVGAYGVLTMYWLWTLVAMFRRSRHFPMYFAMLWVVIVGAVAVDYGVFAWLSGLERDEVRALVNTDMKIKIVGAGLIAGGALWFLTTSRQSKNTFVQ